MNPLVQIVKTLFALVVVVVAHNSALGDETTSSFFRAYYLETHDRDYAAAAKLYAEAIEDRSLTAEQRATATTRRAACLEELASADLAALMPPAALAYVELSRPGERVLGLLKTLGLTATGDPAEAVGRRVVIGPELVRQLLGLRGAAAAVTGFDPFGGKPTGVAVLHAGDVALLRGILETALPAATQASRPIEGCATYEAGGEVYITLTHRLAIVSAQPGEIAAVIRRLRGQEKDSFATNADLREVLAERGDALLFFCANVKPIMPMITAMMTAAGGDSPQLTMAQALLDLGSLQAVAGRLDLGADGVRLDVSVRLAEGHRNLAYNFFRMPPVDRQTLECVPAGAAAFAAFALNEPNSRFAGGATPVGGEKPIVTLMDIGREFFANIVGVGVFVLPPEPGERFETELPDFAAVISVNDPVKSQALWGQMLGIASLAAGGRSLDGETREIAGVKAQRFALPEGMSVYLAISGNTLVVAPGEAALARALAARRSGESILNDPAYRASLDRLSADSTFAAFAHIGRCFSVAQGLDPDDRDLEEVAPIVERMTDTVGSLVVTHSSRVYRLSLMVTGLPKVDDLVSQWIEGRSTLAGRAAVKPARLVTSMRPAGGGPQAPRASESESGRGAIAIPLPIGDAPARSDAEQGEIPAKHAKNAGAIAARPADVKRLIADGAVDEARQIAEQTFEDNRDNAARLNEFAWRWLTEPAYEGVLNGVALRMATRCNQLTGESNWMYVDTLAWAHFKAGDVDRAIDLERKALELCKDDRRIDEVKDALATFEAARAEQQRAEEDTR